MPTLGENTENQSVDEALVLLNMPSCWPLTCAFPGSQKQSPELVGKGKRKPNRIYRSDRTSIVTSPEK